MTRGCQELLESLIEQAAQDAGPITPAHGVELFGGRSQLARELGVTRRTVERYTTTTGGQRRAPRADVRERLQERARRPAGIERLRQRGLTIAAGSEIETCYDDEPEGERDLEGTHISGDEMGQILDAYAQGFSADACEAFNAALFAAYGADALSLCDDEEQEVRIDT